MNVIDDVVGQLKFLGPRPLLEAPLHDTATMLMLSDWHTVVNASLEDEIGVLAGLMTSEIVLVLGPFSSFEYHKQGLNDVISVHVDGEVDDLHVQAGDDLSEDLVIKQVRGCELETLHLLERSLFVLRPFNVLHLTLDSIEDAARKCLDQNLNDSRSMDVE